MARKVKKGDTLIALTKEEFNSWTPNPGWIDEMSNLAGEQGEVVKISGKDIALRFSDGQEWYYPRSAYER